MAAVEVWTPAGTAFLDGIGYEPTARIQASSDVMDRMQRAAESAVHCVSGRVVHTDSGWVAEGDPMEAAVHAWSTTRWSENSSSTRRSGWQRCDTGTTGSASPRIYG